MSITIEHVRVCLRRGNCYSSPMDSVSNPELHLFRLAGVRYSDREEVWNRFHAFTPQEQADQAILRGIQGKVSSQRAPGH